MSNTKLAKPPSVEEQLHKLEVFFLAQQAKPQTDVDGGINSTRALVAKVVERAQMEGLFQDVLEDILSLDALIDWLPYLESLGDINLFRREHQQRIGGVTSFTGEIHLGHNGDMLDHKKLLHILATKGLPFDFLVLFHELIHRKQRESKNSRVIGAAAKERDLTVQSQMESIATQREQSFNTEARTVPLYLLMDAIALMMLFYPANINLLARFLPAIPAVWATVNKIKKMRPLVNAPQVPDEVIQTPMRINLESLLIDIFETVTTEVQAYRADSELGLATTEDYLDEDKLWAVIEASTFKDQGGNPIRQEFVAEAEQLARDVAPKIAVLRSLKVPHAEIAALVTSDSDVEVVKTNLQAKIDILTATHPAVELNSAKILRTQKIKRDRDLKRLREITREEITNVLRSPQYIAYLDEKRQQQKRRERQKGRR